MNYSRSWINQVLIQCAKPAVRSKPEWFHLPNRVWSRQSALLVSLRQRGRNEHS